MVRAGQDLDELARHVVLQAIFQHPVLGEHLILKGALAVEPLTGLQRSTRDVDLTARDAFCPLDVNGRERLRAWLNEATSDRALESIGEDWRAPRPPSVSKRPTKRSHPLGFDAFTCKVTLKYRGRVEYVVELDVSFDDFTGAEIRLATAGGRLIVSTAPEAIVRAYAPEENVAEKLRAFLQKLPPYLKKINRDYPETELPRVRDLRDVHGIVNMWDNLDWALTARAFRKKCRHKFVDCSDPSDFTPEPDSVAIYRRLYEAEFGLASPTFEEAWVTWLAVVARIGNEGGFGGRVELPPQNTPATPSI